MIQTIVFDMGNVLLRYDPTAYLTSRYGSVAAERIFPLLFGSPLWQDCDHGLAEPEDVARAAGEQIPEYKAEILEIIEHWHESMEPIEGMLEIVRSLKAQGYRIYLLSNASKQFYCFRDRVEAFREMDGLFVSADYRLLKPERAIYDTFCKTFDLKAEECLFIDDLPQNVQGAVEAGMSSVCFTGPDALREYLAKEFQILV